MLLSVLKVTMCGVSLILTALFALNLSGVTSEPLPNWVLLDWLSALLMMAIGLCIDGGKYLFWCYRHLGRVYTVISGSLVLFSWLASLAFLLAGEASLILKQRSQFPEYLSYQQEVAALKEEINSRQALAKQQLASRYHEQWQEGEQQLRAIKSLQQTLSQLLLKEAEIGKAGVLEVLPTQRLFVSIAAGLEVDAEFVRLSGFALLALLLELCGLAMISLSAAVTRTTRPPDDIAASRKDGQQDAHAVERARLLCDIVSRDIEPVIRKIKQAGYSLPLGAIKDVLESLKAQGVLEDDIRNSYKYSQNPNQ